MINEINRCALCAKPLITENQDWELLVSAVMTRFKLLAETRGLRAAIADLKASRLAFTRWLAGTPMSGHVGAPITKSGYPKVLPKEYHLSSRDEHAKVKEVLTILSIGRYFKGGDPVDLAAIETPSTSSEDITDDEIKNALQDLGLRPGRVPPFPRGKNKLFKWMSTAGPNGPSLAASLMDLPLFIATFRTQVEVILPEILEPIDKLLDWSPMYVAKLLGLDKYTSKKLRKISVKPDREGKSRVFAIFDYWSQMTLTPLHDWLFDILRCIPEDCTFDQHKGIRQLIAQKSTKWFYSYDLKSATDRFPVAFQERVMAILIDKEYAAAWRDIMTRLPFHFKGTDRPISWACGQPLGAKSSWAMFTLCHHLIVRIAARRALTQAQYVVLGDDIVLRGGRLAVKYRELMALLGVAISEAKSHVSKDTFEFAKVWIRQGINVSGFPLVGLVETMNSPIELAVLLTQEGPRKGFPFTECPRSLSMWASNIIGLWNVQERLAIWNGIRLCWYIAFVKWLETGSGAWASFITQSAGANLSDQSSHDLLYFILKRKWQRIIIERVMDLQKFAFALSRRIPWEVAELDLDDPDFMIVGCSTPNSMNFSDHLLAIPILAALTFESEKEYALLLGNGFAGSDSNMTLEELEALKLPPRPQLKGFEPIRKKESVVALDLITKEMNSSISIFTFQSQASVRTFKRRAKARPYKN